ncbi:aspartate carbamoyltransferase [bacterium]|nr:MAG: aspartate carbamoyltransferase [bacterium]
MDNGGRSLNRKDLLGIEELSREEIELILEQAEGMKEILERPVRKVPALQGFTIANLFFEPSTRTLNSFLLAERRLSADTVNVSASSSSVLKGETLLDTAKNIEAMKVDMVVLRHSCPGAPHFLAKRIDASVINAGDGSHEHPTQALLDLLTIKEKFGKIDGLKVLIVGDIMHSRVARSDILGLRKMGAWVRVCGPPTLIPLWIDELGVEVEYNLDRAMRDVDIIYVLRIQKERQKKGLFPSIREYVKYFCITPERLRQAKEGVVIMHPGPMNRGVEISPEVADGPWSVILDQVTNGVAIRMAIIYLLARRRR